jgi:hypothetical protein
VEVEGVEDFVEAGGEVVDAVEQREDAEVLVDGEVAGERGVDGGEVGAGEGAGAVAEEIDAADGDGAGGGLKDAEDHGDGGGFAGGVDAEEADDFTGADVEGNAADGLYAGVDRTVALAQIFDAEDGIVRVWRGVGGARVVRGGVGHRGSDAIIRREGGSFQLSG